MRKYKNVEYTNPFELLFLLGSTLAIFSAIIIVLNRVMSFGLIKGILAFVLAGIYFYILKKKFIVKISDFELKSNQLEWDNKNVNFNDLEYYKIHWIKGAGIKFKFKNGNTLRISSNDNFCNSEQFVNLCQNIDSKLLKYNKGQIERKRSFFESKQGYYFAVIISILCVIGTIYKSLTDKKINIENFTLILVSLGIIWNGVKWKRK
ncbi:hypothetical protein [Mesoflavibacter sp. SCSIO 43206]|uniref:hypothetical protein n=1 Tax=Mesoflavibacter sp. SCSIO 43206 TaxID=2779362 RepID=UPI001CA7FAA8|nr:hypothetical protein [Mesoflavibacter sp. SCSIO 43206]UAB75676.1 hypothetical protein INR78_01405 [Mesoflavibacter sp. SCSIO 43206]